MNVGFNCRECKFYQNNNKKTRKKDGDNGKVKKNKIQETSIQIKQPPVPDSKGLKKPL